jgi:hypothetical protein
VIVVEGKVAPEAVGWPVMPPLTLRKMPFGPNPHAVRVPVGSLSLTASGAKSGRRIVSAAKSLPRSRSSRFAAKRRPLGNETMMSDFELLKRCEHVRTSPTVSLEATSVPLPIVPSATVIRQCAVESTLGVFPAGVEGESCLVQMRWPVKGSV